MRGEGDFLSLVLVKKGGEKKQVYLFILALALNSASKIYCFHCKMNWFLNLLGTTV